ncbi:hypothetical protein SAMN04487939_10514 [Lysobacter sp. yr284]|uniref:hypothetical protein n=1 Tax=Lysobacter sp. yr284 TaxID=1761791 RepID=UPI00089CC0BE|nr:hypothetical protein [Lysobacter sp. yr284]SDY68908.1 hypothetical protein SAMN04487939_10514 [Lysobacter sp. yr284]
MSYAIAATARLRGWVRSAGVRAVVAAAALAFATAAPADPAAADALLQQAGDTHQLAVSALRAGAASQQQGQTEMAKEHYHQSYQIVAALYGTLDELDAANQDTLARGLYRDRAALERAIALGATAQAQIRGNVLPPIAGLTGDPDRLPLYQQAQQGLIRVARTLSELRVALDAS